jgi:hypothetical protein
MSLEGEELGPTPRVPHPRHPIGIPIEAHGHDSRPIGAERGRQTDASGVPLDGEELGPTPRVLHPRRPIMATGDDARPVRAERRRGDVLGVPPKCQ